MKINSYPRLRKPLWLLLAVFLLFAQPAFAAEFVEYSPPATADRLTDEELLAMPAVSVSYFTAEDGEPLLIDAIPTLSPLGKAYWATLPIEAFSFPMKLTVTASETAPYTFIPISGEPLETDAATVDFNGLSTLITAYENDLMVDTYRLYVSTAQMPSAGSVNIPVYYVDAENTANVLYFEVMTVFYDQVNLITADASRVPANYALVGDGGATVTVDELGQATPAWVTFYFQAQAMQGTVSVYYTDTDGNAVASSQTQTLAPGTHTVYPAPYDLMPGYIPAPESPAQVDVTVDSLGKASPASVTFLYKPQSVTGMLTVNYTDESGAPLVHPEWLELAEGTHAVTPNPALIPAGYVLSPLSQAQVSVSVDSQGNVSPPSVAFLYAPEQAEPATGELTVYYADLSGAQIIQPERRTLAQGQHAVTPSAAAVPAEYILSPSSQTQYTVTVDATGAVSPASVTFLYERAQQQPATGTLTIQYLDVYGAQIGSTQTIPLETGTHIIGIDSSTIPAGYALDASSPSEITVTVDAYGNVSPASITFVLAKTQAAIPPLNPVEAYAVTNTTAVNFRSGPEILGTGNVVFPQTAQGTKVWVYGTFTLDGQEWAAINYGDTDCYVLNSLIDPVAATPEPAAGGILIVRYQTAGGAAIANDQMVSLSAGDHTVTPDSAVVPQGYALAEGTPAQYGVTVDAYGNASPASVVFTYQAQAAEATPEPDKPADMSALYPDYAVVDAPAATSAAGVRFRSTPDTASDANILYRVDTGTAVWVHGVFTIEGLHWAYIRYAETDCFVWYSLITPDGAAPTETLAPTAPPDDSPVYLPTEAPIGTPSPADIAAQYPDYAVIGASAVTNDTGVRLRSAPDSSDSENVLQKVNMGSPVWVYGSFTANGKEWAYVNYENADCFVWKSLLDLNPAAEPTPTQAPAAIPAEMTDDSIWIANPPVDTQTETPTETPFAGPTATPPYMPDGSNPPADITAIYPNYAVIGRPATTNITQVRIRVKPDSSADETILYTVSMGTPVWVHGSIIVDGTEWAYIRYDMRDCYVWMSLLNLDYAFVTPTPSPTPTPTPTPTPAPTASPEPTDKPTPTAEPTQAPTNTPFIAPTAAPTDGIPDDGMYEGFGVTLTQVALRHSTNFDDGSIIRTLPPDTLLYLHGQGVANGTVWSSIQTFLGEETYGFLPFASVRTITDNEAQLYIDAYNQANAPTPSPSPSPSPTPAQQTGYFLTLGDDVPLRSVPVTQSAISAWLAEDQAVYVSGQVYGDGYRWHISNYYGVPGYIRDDQIRPMSAQEVAAYLAQTSPTPTPAQTAAPYNPDADSSYGYVTADKVNFRETPGGTRIKTLNKYAFALVLGSRYVSDAQWYNINQSGTVGWISGDFFDVLSLSGLPAFLNSSEYLQGIMNSSSDSPSSSTTTSSATQGQVSAVEDWNLDVWQNPSSSLNASYEPFNPYATPTAALAVETPTPEPTATFVIGTMIPITYEDDSTETQPGTNWLGLALGGIVLVGGAGGVYAYALTQNKKRKAAARNAAARQRSQQNNAPNPYARRAAAAPPVTPGQQQNGQNPYQRPNPYARPPQNTQNPYAQPQDNGRNPNPYAQRSAPFSAQEPQAPPPANPYARPQQPERDDADRSDTQPPYAGRRSDRHRNRDDD